MLGWRESNQRETCCDSTAWFGHQPCGKRGAWRAGGVASAKIHEVSACESAPVPGAWHWGADRDEALRLAAEVIELRLRHGYVVK